MLIAVGLVHSILLSVIHADSIKSRVKRKNEFYSESTGKGRQINISGRIKSFQDVVHIGMRCIGTEIYPLEIKIFPTKMVVSTSSEETSEEAARTFSIGPVNMNITVFSNKFHLSINDSSGHFVYDYAPLVWFEKDPNIANHCPEREIVYATNVFTHDAITVPNMFRYTHGVSFFVGDKIRIRGSVTDNNEGFAVSIRGSETDQSSIIVSFRGGKLHLQCGNDEKIIEGVGSIEELRITISVKEEFSKVRIKDGLSKWNSSCSHAELFTKLNTIVIEPASAVTLKSPTVETNRTPVYVARYTDDSAYSIYNQKAEHSLNFMQKLMSGGAYRYGLDVNNEGWTLLPAQTGSIGFSFDRLPFHFVYCPCDCLSDPEDVILMHDDLYSRNFTDSTSLRTIVFYQWLQGVGIHFEIDKLFSLEIFFIGSEYKKSGCDWSDSEMIITSIADEIEAIDETDNTIIKEFIDPTTLNGSGILMWNHQTDGYYFEVNGKRIYYDGRITFIQVVGLRGFEPIAITF